MKFISAIRVDVFTKDTAVRPVEEVVSDCSPYWHTTAAAKSPHEPVDGVQRGRNQYLKLRRN